MEKGTKESQTNDFLINVDFSVEMCQCMVQIRSTSVVHKIFTLAIFCARYKAKFFAPVLCDFEKYC